MVEPIFQDVYRFLSSPHSIWAMAKAGENGRPALKGVVKELESKFFICFTFCSQYIIQRPAGLFLLVFIFNFSFAFKGINKILSTNYIGRTFTK